MAMINDGSIKPLLFQVDLLLLVFLFPTSQGFKSWLPKGPQSMSRPGSEGLECSKYPGWTDLRSPGWTLQVIYNTSINTCGSFHCQLSPNLLLKPLSLWKRLPSGLCAGTAAICSLRDCPVLKLITWRVTQEPVKICWTFIQLTFENACFRDSYWLPLRQTWATQAFQNHNLLPDRSMSCTCPPNYIYSYLYILYQIKSYYIILHYIINIFASILALCFHAQQYDWPWEPNRSQDQDHSEDSRSPARLHSQHRCHRSPRHLPREMQILSAKVSPSDGKRQAHWWMGYSRYLHI